MSVVADNKPVKAVIMDTDFSLNSTQMIRAQLYLRNPDCLFLVGTTDQMLPTGQGFKIIGKCGSESRFLRQAKDGVVFQDPDIITKFLKMLPVARRP